ncbi:hypothetical protein IWQ61_007449 [Dispira simplex]|nr:hypothetical protein IWQ61_007449 [Dispira simplex]
MTDQELYRVISRALRNQVIHQTTFSLMALIVCRNLFVPVKYTRFSTAPIQRLCLAMNVLMSVCVVVMLLRGIVYEACVIFGITFSTLYVGTISFLGFILLTKTYYASNYHKVLLAALLFVESVVVGPHIHAVTQSSFSNENGKMLCGFTQDQRSSTIALVSEVVYNLFVTVDSPSSSYR